MQNGKGLVMSLFFANQVDESQRITVDERGKFQYPSAAATGHVEIVLPAAHGPNGEERMLVKDFGRHVAREVSRSLAPNPYPVTSPRRTATDTFRHYVGAAKGASLLDEEGTKQMTKMAAEFEAARNPQEYFDQVIKPYMMSMSPRRR